MRRTSSGRWVLPPSHLSFLLPLLSSLCSLPPPPSPPPPLLCNVRLLERKISQVSSSQCLLHYAMLFLPTKWKMLQTLPILIKHISASVVASSFPTISFKTKAKIKVTFFPLFAALLIHTEWFASSSLFFSFHVLIQEGSDIQLSERMEFSITIDPITSCIIVWL